MREEVKIEQTNQRKGRTLMSARVVPVSYPFVIYFRLNNTQTLFHWLCLVCIQRSRRVLMTFLFATCFLALSFA